MTIRAILWDFGDTLCDQTWMRAPMEGEPDWAVAYLEVLASDNLAARWDVGGATAADIADAVALRLSCDARRVAAHMRACCRDVRFYPKVMEVVASMVLPQAIVTINPDIFTEVVVPTYALDERFATIVTSWQEGSADKADLCEIARHRLAPDLCPEECLLIDNRRCYT